MLPWRPQLDDMKGYSVSQLAELAGVSIRTLHHYDDIGLLEPGGRTAAGYRWYGPEEVSRLQQILFFRELDFPLEEIRNILDSPFYNPVSVLKDQQKLIRERIAGLRRQERIIAATLEEKIMSDAEKFAGFDDSVQEEYLKEARRKYGAATVDASEAEIARWRDSEKASAWKEGEDIARELAVLMNGPADAPEALALAERQHAFVRRFWDCDIRAFREMGKLYDEDERFTAFYDKHARGTAGFFRQVIEAYADRAEGGS